MSFIPYKQLIFFFVLTVLRSTNETNRETKIVSKLALNNQTIHSWNLIKFLNFVPLK